MKKFVAVTHNGRFHADDVFAAAILKLLHADRIVITRTRAVAEINAADIVFDVGMVFDAERRRFDHHQEGAPHRSSGIPYSSAGLLWREFGHELLTKIAFSNATKHQLDEAWEKLDRDLFLTIDKLDNGIGAPMDGDISTLVAQINPTFLEGDHFDISFIEAVEFAKAHLARFVANLHAEIVIAPQHRARLLAHARAESVAEAAIKAAATATDDPRLIILERNLPFREAVFRIGLDDLLYVISPSSTPGQWGLEAVPVDPTSFKSKRSLPASWAGLSPSELQEISGVKDALFAHRGLFFAAAGSREGALSLARLALQEQLP